MGIALFFLFIQSFNGFRESSLKLEELERFLKTSNCENISKVLKREELLCLTWIWVIEFKIMVQLKLRSVLPIISCRLSNVFFSFHFINDSIKPTI